MNETQDLCALAPLFGMDILDPAETRAFELHLSGCDTCAREVQQFRETAALLGASVAVSPPAGLREKVIQRAISESGGVLVRKNQGQWVDTPFPGVQTKILFKDPISGSVTMLVKVGPGGFYPSHFHSGLEHSYVLEGDLTFEDHTLYAGDYEVAGADTVHSPVRSVNGCVVLLINHVHDHILR